MHFYCLAVIQYSMCAGLSITTYTTGTGTVYLPSAHTIQMVAFSHAIRGFLFGSLGLSQWITTATGYCCPPLSCDKTAYTILAEYPTCGVTGLVGSQTPSCRHWKTKAISLLRA